jgi:mRNA interferase MazF
MRKGEIYLVEIPSNSGHEQEGLRPVIIMSEVNAGVVNIIPFTSNSYALKYPYTIRIGLSDFNKLKKDSVALVFQLRAIDVRKLNNRIGVIEDEVMSEVDNLIKKLLNLI